MSIRGSRALWTSLLAVFLVGCLFATGTGKQSSEELAAAPPSGFWTIADDIAVSSFSDGNYVLEVRSGTAWGRLDLGTVAEFRAATRIQLAAGSPAQAAGIVFDYQKADSFSVFLVTGDGWCGLWEFDGRAYRSVSGWQKDGAIRLAGEWNTLTVTVSDDFARCSVNGREVLAAPHPKGTGGDVGLAAAAWGSGRASFDYLRVCNLGEVLSFDVSIVQIKLVESAGLGESFSHYASVDGGVELPIRDEGSVLVAGEFSGVRVIPVRIRTAQTVEEGATETSTGSGSVQLVLYSCEPGSQQQTVRVRVCGDRGAGLDCDSVWAEWEYVLRVVVN
jgi:hypothetical protein